METNLYNIQNNCQWHEMMKQKHFLNSMCDEVETDTKYFEFILKAMAIFHQIMRLIELRKLKFVYF